MVGGWEYCLFLEGEEGYLYFFPRSRICPCSLKIAWLREKVKSIQSSRSRLILVMAEKLSFHETKCLSFTLPWKGENGIHAGQDGIHAGQDGIHAGIKLYHLYNHNLARFSLAICCHVIWGSWLSLVIVRVLSLCVGGRGNALAHHACQVRTLSTSWALDSHALSHALSVVAIT